MKAVMASVWREPCKSSTTTYAASADSVCRTTVIGGGLGDAVPAITVEYDADAGRPGMLREGRREKPAAELSVR